MKVNRLFNLACCGLGLMAFSQLLIAGMALAVRVEEGRQVKIIEKKVERLVPIQISMPVPNDPPAQSIAAAEPILPPVPEPEQLATPAIADPRSELLVTEARKARIAGDMAAAIVKLEEALGESPGDPTVLYELGMVHEMMGVYEKAADYYEQVFQLGVSGAGNLYEAAAAKLRDGFDQPGDMRGKLALGRVRIFNDAKAAGGQRVVLTIPVQKAPGQEVETPELQMEVLFFNKTDKGAIVPLASEEEAWAQHSWVSMPFDWAGGEESLRVNYRIPLRDEQTTHLFGELSYYGQVVTLRYKGEVLDVEAWPRDLAARIGQAPPVGEHPGDFPEFLDQDILPPNFDPDIPLLNPLPGE